MKEQMPIGSINQELTTRSQKPYPEVKDVFMTEKTDEINKPAPQEKPAPINPEQWGLKSRQVSPEELQNQFQHYADINYGGDRNKVTYEEREALKKMVEHGIAGEMPPTATEEIEGETVEPEEVETKEQFLKRGLRELSDEFFAKRFKGQKEFKGEAQSLNLFLNRYKDIVDNPSLATPDRLKDLLDDYLKEKSELKIKPDEYEKATNFAELIERTRGFLESTVEPEGIRAQSYMISKSVDKLFNRIKGVEAAEKAGLTVGAEYKRNLEEQRIDLHKRLVEFLESVAAIETHEFPSEILGAVKYYKDLREALLSELIFKPFEEESETGGYDLTLYALSNLDILLGYLKQEDKDRYKYFFSLRTAAQYFHGMNASLQTGNFEDFGRITERINYKHFLNMRDINASPLVMRLFEKEFDRCLSKDKRITQKRYEEIRKNVVRERLIHLNEKGVIKSEFADLRREFGEKDPDKMQDWEIDRAMGAGRTFFHITIRGAEKIATGQIPHGLERITSFPMENIVRVLNWNEWFLRRFDFGKSKHGIEFMDKILKRWREFLKYRGVMLGINRIKEFGGVDVTTMENAGQYNTSGVYSGYRIQNLMYKGIKLEINGEEITIADYLAKLKTKEKDGLIDELEQEIEERQKTLFLRKKKIKGSAITKEHQERYLALWKPVIDKLDVGLAVLIKGRDIGGGGDFPKLGYLVRQAAWEKVAEKNIPLMINYLSGLEYENQKKDLCLDPLERKEGETDEEFELRQRDLEQKQKSLEPNYYDEKVNDKARLHARSIEKIRKDFFSDLSDEQWNTLFAEFEDNVNANHELQIRRAIGNDVRESLEFSGEHKEQAEKLLKIIKAEAAKLAPDLADVLFPYMPFMNDMPLEIFDYEFVGQEFYRRRAGSDLAGYNAGQKAHQEFIENPGGLGAEVAMKKMKEIVSAISGPEGDRFAQEANIANIWALLDISMTTPGMRQGILKTVLEGLKIPTSEAQRWAGMEADSFTEALASNFIEKARKEGLITPELAGFLRKKKNAGLAFLLWMIFRDVFLIGGPLSLATAFTKEVTKATQ